jgi:hypothetical protein
MMQGFADGARFVISAGDFKDMTGLEPRAWRSRRRRR